MLPNLEKNPQFSHLIRQKFLSNGDLIVTFSNGYKKSPKNCKLVRNPDFRFAVLVLKEQIACPSIPPQFFLNYSTAV